MTLQESHDRIGDRVRTRRLDLGKTMRQVADDAGIAHTTLGRYERGELGLSNRFQLAAIARALKCSPEFLAGVVVPAGANRAEVISRTYDTVHAILGADLDFEPEPSGPAGPEQRVDALADRTARAIDLRQRCEYAALTGMLPTLVDDLYQATGGDGRDLALAMLVRVTEAASFAVRFTGDPRSATIASDRCRQAAAALGEPVLVSFAEWARAHTALGCGLHERAGKITAKAIGALVAAPHAPGRLEMLGMLNLTHAFALVGAGRPGDADAPLDEATALAARTGETDTLALMFGPTNVDLWRLAIAVDSPDPMPAVPLIDSINPRVIPSPSRQACFFQDAARAMGRLGDTARAVQLFETAERIAPERTHGDPIMVAAIRDLIEGAKRRAVSTRLLGLASRVGVPA